MDYKIKIRSNLILASLSILLGGFLFFSLNLDPVKFKSQNLESNLSKFSSWKSASTLEPKRSLSGNQLPRGWIHEITTDGYAIGWALDPDNYNVPISVHAYFDGPAGTGKFPVVAIANLSYQQAGLPNGLTTYSGNHAFRLPLSTQVKDGVPHSIYIHGIDTNDTSGASNTLVWNSGMQFKYPFTPYAVKPKISETNKWGVNNDISIAPWAISGTNGAGLTSQQSYDFAQEAGMGWVRYTFYWNNLNPEQGVFDWSVTDKEIEIMTKSGLNIYASILWAPAWTTGGYYADGSYSYQPFHCMNSTTYLYTPTKQGCSNVTPDVNAFSTFVTEAVKRYGDKVKYWGFANESASGVFWHGADVVNNVLIPGYEAAKVANSNVVIVGPDETAGDGIQHLDYILTRDQQYKNQTGKNFLDVISFHAYGNNDSVSHTLSLIDNQFKTVIDKYKGNRPVWITEGGLRSKQSTFMSQADGLKDLFREISQKSWVDKFILYRLKGGTLTNEDYGITLGDTGLPKPAYYTVREYITGRNNTLSNAPLGNFDGLVKGDLIIGWAFDPDSSSESILVQVYFDGPAGAGGTLGSSAVANFFRPDVNQTFGTSGNHGFILPFPESYKDGRNHDVYLYAIDSTDLNSRSQLSGSPQNYIIQASNFDSTIKSRGSDTSLNRSPSLPQATHPIMFGYYHVDSQYGDFKDEIKNYTNTQIILEESFIRRPTVTNSDIQKLNDAFNETKLLNHKTVYAPATNQNDWSSSIDMAKPYWGDIEFIYFYDEPRWDKTTTERNITEFKNLVSGKGLAQKPIAINYTPQQILDGTSHQADNLDIIGFEAYMDPALQDSPILVQTLSAQIDRLKQKAGNKKIFIVIQGYNRNGTWKNMNSLVDIQTSPYLKTYNDNDVIGLFVFSYARPGGTKDNSILKDSHRAIWAAISGSVVSNTQFSGQIANLGAGVFPDVAFYKDRILVTYQAQKPNAVILLSFKPDLTDRREEKRFTSSDLAFSRLYVDSNGILWHSWRDADDKIKLWRNDKPNEIETVSSEPSGANGAIMGYNQIAWNSNDFQTVYTRELSGGTAQVARTGNYPTGISRILPNGDIRYVDEDRNLLDWGLEPSFAGALTIAVGQTEGNYIRFNNESSQLSIFPGESFTPRAATNGNTDYAVITWGKSGIRLATLQGPSSNGDTERGGTSEGIIPSGGQPFPLTITPTPPTQGLPTNLGQLIQQIFGWSLSILGISVFVMFFYSGFLWLTAAGNTSKIGEARTHMTNAVFGAILLLSSYLILYTINPDFVKNTVNLPGLGTTTGTPPGTGSSGGGGSGVCKDAGGSANYSATLRSAINAVLAANTEGIADATNTTSNGFKLLGFVVEELKKSGFNATTNVKNGNDNPNQGDLIALWRTGDTTVERYDAIVDSGSGNKPLKESTGADYTGDIPLNCTF